MASADIETLAKGLAIDTHGWDALHLLPDEDITAIADTLADMEIRKIALLRNAGRAVPDHIHTQVNTYGAHLAIALQEMVEPSDAPKPKKARFHGS